MPITFNGYKVCMLDKVIHYCYKLILHFYVILLCTIHLFKQSIHYVNPILTNYKILTVITTNQIDYL